MKVLPPIETCNAAPSRQRTKDSFDIQDTMLRVLGFTRRSMISSRRCPGRRARCATITNSSSCLRRDAHGYGASGYSRGREGLSRIPVRYERCACLAAFRSWLLEVAGPAVRISTPDATQCRHSLRRRAKCEEGRRQATHRKDHFSALTEDEAAEPRPSNLRSFWRDRQRTSSS